MTYLPSGSLQDQIATGCPRAWSDAAQTGVKLAGALETAHRLAIIHRDVKPHNVLLSESGEPLLADFGIARVEGRFETSTGQNLASLLYAAPEVLDGERPTAVSDVYSLAATIYCLLSGAPPFRRGPEEPVAALYVRIATSAVPDLRPRGVPAELCQLLERALAKDPDERPASAVAFAELLRDIERTGGRAPTRYLTASGYQTALGDADVERADAATGTATVAVPAVADGAAAIGPPLPQGSAKPRQRATRRTRKLVGVTVTAGALAAALLGAFLVSRAAPPTADRIAGLWAGTVPRDGGKSLSVQIEIRRGCSVGESCGAISVSTVPCFGQATLKQIHPNGSFEFNVGNFYPGSNPTDCTPGPGDIFALAKDGSLFYTPTYDNTIRMSLHQIPSV